MQGTYGRETDAFFCEDELIASEVFGHDFPLPFTCPVTPKAGHVATPLTVASRQNKVVMELPGHTTDTALKFHAWPLQRGWELNRA